MAGLGILTPASVDEFRILKAKTAAKYGPMMGQYRTEYDAAVAEFTSLKTWLKALDDRDWNTLENVTLWRELRADGFLEEMNDGKPRALAFVMPQHADGTESPAQFLTSIRKIEEQAGLNFLSEMEDRQEEQLEERAAPGLW